MLLSIAVFASCLFIAVVIYACFRIFMPRANWFLNIAVIVGLAAIVIARVSFNNLAIYRKSIEIDNDKMILKNGGKIIDEYPFADYGFGSKIHNHYYYGIKVSVKRVLVISSGTQEKKIACDFLSKDDFNQLMSMLDNYSLRYEHAVASEANSTATETVTPQPQVSATYQLRTENLKVNYFKALLPALIFGGVLALIFLVPLISAVLEDRNIPSNDMKEMLLFALIALGATIVVGIVCITTRRSKINTAKFLTPQTITLSNDTIVFEQDSYNPADITSIEAIPVSYNNPNRGAYAMRPLKITTNTGRTKLYNLGTCVEPKDLQQAVFSAEEYSALLYDLRLIFVDRPGVFSHQLESPQF